MFNTTTMLKITEEMREAARQLLKNAAKLDRSDRDLLEAIANGKRKLIDGRWWKEMHHYVVAQPKRAKLAAYADPARNDNVHERAVAAAMLAKFKARRPPGLPPEPPPLPKTLAEWEAKRRVPAKSAKHQVAPVKHHLRLTPQAKPVAESSEAKPFNTTKPDISASAKPVSTTKPRSADRHREPNRDRHSPGYMRAYMRDHMRRRRGAQKPAFAARAGPGYSPVVAVGLDARAQRTL
jgi:hypothetical protein